MTIKLTGDTLDFVKDIIRYGKRYPESMADIMVYDVDAFIASLNQLDRALSIGWDGKERYQ